MNNIVAVAGVVIKELYRRKDFYVLFILTVLICLVMASVNFFNDDKIVRYLKEICLLLVWICSLVIAITTTARQIPSERENRTLVSAAGQAVDRERNCSWENSSAAGSPAVWRWSAFTPFSALLAATREHHWPLLNYLQAASLHWVMLGVVIAFALLGSLIFTRAFLQHDDLFCRGDIHFGPGPASQQGRAATAGAAPLGLVPASTTCIPHLELFDVRDLIIHNWPPIAWTVCGVAALYGWRMPPPFWSRPASSSGAKPSTDPRHALGQIASPHPRCACWCCASAWPPGWISGSKPGRATAPSQPTS